MKRTPLGPGRAALERGSTFQPRSSSLQSNPKGSRGTLKTGKGFAASKAQREKVKAQVCAVCQQEPCDPAHLAPRALGRGCDSVDCCIALCRIHHEQFDRGDLDLLPHISGAGFEVELAHMQGHYSDPLSVVIRLSGHRWVPEEKAA